MHILAGLICPDNPDSLLVCEQVRVALLSEALFCYLLLNICSFKNSRQVVALLGGPNLCTSVCDHGDRVA
ncbi:hypothetical protein Bpfe_021536 [Biomphalaria pfeifferi]|uniref:Uncharacterized protein n=1 Tax=Biomphalaria pfeifferi TaxID=112525 RepID=A0AAD8B6U0_BIOPF|nr:hypothetical protein Bpfe_021536 [Biomphalaria pfeifferi]